METAFITAQRSSRREFIILTLRAKYRTVEYSIEQALKQCLCFRTVRMSWDLELKLKVSKCTVYCGVHVRTAKPHILIDALYM